MSRPPLWYLKNVELFKGLSDEDMMELLQGLLHSHHENKQFLYTPEDSVENVFILKEGEVTLYKAVDGKKIILDVLKPGAVFGNIGFNPDTGENHFAEVTQKAYICTLPHDFFLQIIQKRPDIALQALKVLSKRVSQYEMQIRTLSALQARDRILATIHLLNEKEDSSILPPILRTNTKITHERLGNMTGLTRETVTKQLAELEKEELLYSEKKHIRLTEAGLKAVMDIV
ncbi:MAG: Crp/Fnr family transcriptional regulator [Candidatus Peribacter sp.]|nr:Crp/Fnr family transcriptional regulator [Candidatus Peribacter sp.]MBT4392571.1 Crp/Fnr family transcriptional regulator [Candidatus Peribacter sp.]MBT4601426.1 Crp/Fnr family transcriptional regulator [Candidatus Peribacter sp.]MBT5149109.1 Crp/Fnr family transcriptional regulator [Candidatus Peribacter sp.]MBT5638116.1 Crp/Fnr family transcriptional regulator [Candidatus Peribacter sp.]